MSTKIKKKSSNSNSSNNVKSYEIFLNIGIEGITDKICNTIWRGEELSEFDQDTLDTISKSISATQLDAILSQLKDIANNVPLAPIITIDTSNKQLPSKKKEKDTKKKKKKQPLTKQKRKNRNGDQDEMDLDDEEEEEEEEEEDEEKAKQEEEEEEEEDVNIDFNNKCNVIEEQQVEPNEFLEFTQQSMIPVNSLCVLLYWMIESDSRGRELQYLASSVYLYMIVLTRRVFHPSTYRSVLKLLKVKQAVNKKPDIFSSQSQSTQTDEFSQDGGDTQMADLSDNDDSCSSNDENDQANSNQKSKKGKPTSKKGSSQTNKANIDDTAKWLPSIIDLLQDLYYILDRFSLDSFIETFEHTVEVISGMSRTINFRKSKSATAGKKTTRSRTQNQATPDEAKLVSVAFKVLHTLVSGRHGVVSRVLPPVLKEIVPMLTLMTIQGTLPPTVPKQLIADRDNAIEFINQLFHSNPTGTYESLLVLLQHICVRVAEKADYRGGAVDSITKVLESTMVDTDCQRFIQFLLTYSKNTKSNYRLFSVEVALSLLTNEITINLNQGQFIPKLLGILVQRSSDKVSTVRSKALSCLAQLLQDEKIIDTLRPHLRIAFGMEDENQEEEQSKKSNSTTPNDQSSTLMKFLSKRADDEKSGVRKSAIQVLEVICLQDNISTTTSPNKQKLNNNNTVKCNRIMIDVLAKRTHDTSPLIRKQVIQSLTRLFNHFRRDVELGDAWISSVLPMIADRENTVSDKSLEAIFTMILTPIENGTTSIANGDLTTMLLDRIVRLEMTAYLHKCCIIMSQKKLITPQLIKGLQSLIKSATSNDSASNNTTTTGLIGSWTLLSKIGYCCPEKLDQQLIISTWNRYRDEINNDSAPDQVIQLVSNILILMEQISPHLSDKQANEIFNDILFRVKQFTYHPQHVNLFVAIMVQVTARINKDLTRPQIQKAIDSWAKDVLSICDEGLYRYVFGNSNNIESMISSQKSNEDNEDVNDEVDENQASQSGIPLPPPINTVDKSKEEELIGQYLFAIGEIIQIPQITIPSRLKTMVQALIAPTRATISNTVVDGQSQTTATDSAIPQSIRAHAFITLGKLCLGDDRLAKKCIATFAKELEVSDSPVIRNNVMIVMCDLCIRYTQLVDNYIPNIARCLRDKSELVRRQTLILLTRLLQEDYVKWKGSLFYRFVESLVDPSPTVSQFSHFCLMNVLQAKYGASVQNTASSKSAASAAAKEGSSADGAAAAQSLSKNIFYTHFLDTIFVLNECTAHPNYNKESNNQMIFSIGNNNTGGAFKNDEYTLKGDEGRKKRMQIYTIFLQNIADEHRFQLVSKLAHDVLAEVADERIPLQACANVVYDTLCILSCKEIKLQTIGKSSQEPGDEEVTAAEAAVSAAQSKLLSSIVKKNTIEFIVPVVIQLKHLFEKKRSPLIRELMAYLKELYKDYKTEMNDVMAADKQLAKEIEYDLKNYNKKLIQSPSRLSITSVMTPNKAAGSMMTPGKSMLTLTPGKQNGATTTPAKADLTNFVVPQLRTPKSRQSIGGLPSSASKSTTTPGRLSLGNAINTTTPNKPFATPIGRLSLQSALTPSSVVKNKLVPSTPIPMMNLQSLATASSPNGQQQQQQPTTGVKSALRLSMSSKTSSDSSTTPYKNLRFSLPNRNIDDSDESDNENESNIIKLDLSLDPEEQAKPAKKWNVKISEDKPTEIEPNDVDDVDEDDNPNDIEEDDDELSSEDEKEASPPKKVKKMSKSSNIKSTTTVNKKQKTTHKKKQLQLEDDEDDDDEYKEEEEEEEEIVPIKKKGKRRL